MIQIINQQIEKEIFDYLESFKDNFIEQCFTFKMINGWCGDQLYQVEVNGYYKDDIKSEEQTDFILLRLFINYQYKQVQITNIFLPDFMRYKGIGKKLIHKIFQVSEKEHYGLFVVDMVNSFYQRLIKRGALPCDNHDDAVQIVSETNLF